MIGTTDDRCRSPKVQAGLAIKNPRSAGLQFFSKRSKIMSLLTSAVTGLKIYRFPFAGAAKLDPACGLILICAFGAMIYERKIIQNRMRGATGCLAGT